MALVLLTGPAAAVRVAAATCTPAPAGLVGWWPGDGNANDIIGTNNGTLQGTAVANAAGVNGQAFRFDGTNGYVQIPDSPAFHLTNLTVECWVRFASYQTTGTSAYSNQQYIVFKQNSKAYEFEGFALTKDHDPQGDVFLWEVASPQAELIRIDSVSTVITGVWYHVVGVRGPDYVKLYKDGQLEATASVNFPQDYGNLPLYFGTSGQAYYEHRLNGDLDEVSLYNRALSAGEIAALYAAGAAGKCKGANGLRITAQPRSQSALPGSDVSFSVAAWGAPQLSFQWRKNGVDLVDGGNTFGTTSSNLVITGLQFPDAGSYTVVVTNDYGSVTSSPPAVLTVRDALPPALSITSHSDLQLLNTANVTLAGTASDAGQGDNGIASVTVNGKRAAHDTCGGGATANWSCAFSLAPGSNQVRVIAKDSRGNAATNTIRLVSDTARPTITIISPVKNQRWSNAVFTVTGTAKDNVQVAGVWCQTNGVWGPASTGTPGANWAVDMALAPGTNTVQACAVDGVGNRSVTNAVSFFYVVPCPLTLRTNGVGAIARNFKGNILEAGRSYTLTAVPGAGQVFSNWVGSVTSSSPVLNFRMQPGMALQANFIPNPFLRAKGTYNGLFAGTGRAQESSGFVTLSVTDQGAYTGSLRQGTNAYGLIGQFDVAGGSSQTVRRPRANSWTVTMRLDLAGAEALTGTVGDGNWLADLRADRAVFNAQTNPATQYAGKYTLIIPGSADASASPGGHGYGSLAVTGAGQVALGGSLADGSALSQSVPVSRDGRWPLYATLYSGKGSVWGWLLFDTNQPSAALSGLLSWIKPAQPGARYYSGGFTNAVEAEGLRYTPPTGITNRVIHLTNGVVSFEGGNLSAPFTNLVSLTLSNKVINASSNALSLSLTLSSGRFSGSATVPGTRQSVSFKGALLQSLDAGYGYFLGTNQSGSVYFGE